MEWIEKDRSACKSQFDGDVMLSTTVTKGRRIICFRFRKNSHYKIVQDSEPFVVVAKDGTRVYFKKASQNTGFKLREIDETSKYLRVPASKRFDIPADRTGEYNIKYDKELMLCYIDTAFKLERDIHWFGKE